MYWGEAAGGQWGQGQDQGRVCMGVGVGGQGWFGEDRRGDFRAAFSGPGAQGWRLSEVRSQGNWG